MSVCPPYAPFFGFAGVASAVSRSPARYFLALNPLTDDTQQYVHIPNCSRPNTHAHFAAVGAAYGTAKAGIGIAGLGTFKPELIMKVRSLRHHSVLS